MYYYNSIQLLIRYKIVNININRILYKNTFNRKSVIVYEYMINCNGYSVSSQYPWHFFSKLYFLYILIALYYFIIEYF